MGRGQVHDASKLWLVNQPLDGAAEVRLVNPGDILPPSRQAAAQAPASPGDAGPAKRCCDPCLNPSLTQPVIRQIPITLLQRDEEVGGAGVKLDN
jgi:hypothetical protein